MLTNDTTDDMINMKLMRLFFLCENNIKEEAKMNKGLQRFDMDRTPIHILETHPMAKSGFETAQKFGCEGTRQEAYRAGFGRYIN